MSGFSGLNPLPVANGGTGGTTSTGSGAVVLATSPTLTTPVFSSITNTGTVTLPTASDTLVARGTTDTLTNKTINGSSNTLTVLAGSQLSGTVPIANGGTGDTGTAWTSYTPTITSSQSTGTVTTTATGRYKTIGKTVFIEVNVVVGGIFTVGTITQITLPVNNNSSSQSTLSGREITNTGVSWVGSLYSSSVGFIYTYNYSGSSAVITGNTLVFSGTYESA